jgi:hypothetical protein
VQLDTENKNTLWAESIKTEFKQINDYETFRVQRTTSTCRVTNASHITVFTMSSLTVDENVAWLPEDIERTPKEDILRSRVHGSCTLGFHFGKQYVQEIKPSYMVKPREGVRDQENLEKTLAKEWL